MARKSTKQARWDSMSQRDQRREKRKKLATGRKDANKFGERILSKLKEGADGTDKTNEA